MLSQRLVFTVFATHHLLSSILRPIVLAAKHEGYIRRMYKPAALHS